jgi:hypothetical protein
MIAGSNGRKKDPTGRTLKEVRERSRLALPAESDLRFALAALQLEP